MRNFNKNNKPGRGGYNRRDSGRPTMHPAVCDSCGNDCEVPFKPTGDKPIYCSDCFKRIEPKRSDSRGGQRSGFGDKKMFKAVCDKCGKDCEVPFRPSAGKPIFCDNCFVRDPSTSSGQRDKVGARTSSKGGGQSNDQLAQINAKLDEILKALSPSTIKAKPKTKAAPTKKKEAKPKPSTPQPGSERASSGHRKPATKKKTTKKK